MAWVDGGIDCKVCENEAFESYRTNTGESYVSCFHCGLVSNWLLDRDADGNVQFIEVTVDKELKVNLNNGVIESEEIDIEPKTEKKWKYKLEEKPGFGAYRIMSNEGGGQLGCFDEPVKQEKIDEFLKLMEDETINKEESYLVLYNPETKEFTNVFGKVNNRF